MDAGVVDADRGSVAQPSALPADFTGSLAFPPSSSSSTTPSNSTHPLLAFPHGAFRQQQQQQSSAPPPSASPSNIVSLGTARDMTGSPSHNTRSGSTPTYVPAYSQLPQQQQQQAQQRQSFSQIPGFGANPSNGTPQYEPHYVQQTSTVAPTQFYSTDSPSGGNTHVENPVPAIVLQTFPNIRILAEPATERADSFAKWGMLPDGASMSINVKRARIEADATGSAGRSPTPQTSNSLSAPSKPKVPTDPTERVEHDLLEIFEDEDFDDLEVVEKVWVRIADLIQIPEQKALIISAVTTIVKNFDDTILRSMGQSTVYVARLRKWVVADFNSDKNSRLTYFIVRLLHKMQVPLSIFQQTKWDKVLGVISRKCEIAKARECATALTEFYIKMEKTMETEEAPKPKPLRTNDTKPKAGPVSSTTKKDTDSRVSSMLKRKSEEEVKGAADRAKKPALGDGKLPSSSSLNSKPYGPAGPVKNGLSSVAGDKKALGSAGSSSNVPHAAATAAAKAKPASGSSFFSSLTGKKSEPAKSQTKIPSKPAPKPTPASGSAFTSIFEQLKQRQDEKKTDKNEVESGDGSKKTTSGKKKKSVRWKAQEELTQVKVFEWIEPEGEYYGGGSGNADWDSARGLDKIEGREALAALKNRANLDEEDDFIDWCPPTEISFKRLEDVTNQKSAEYPRRRGGSAEPQSEEAKVQAQREKETLFAIYNSMRDIPPSPMEPSAENDGSKEPETAEVIIPLPDSLLKFGTGPAAAAAAALQTPAVSQPAAPPTTDLSTLLSGIQQQQKATTQPLQQPNELLAALAMFTQQQPQQPAVQVQQPQTQQMDWGSLLSAIQPNQQAQAQAPQAAQASWLQSLIQPGANTMSNSMLAALGAGGTPATGMNSGGFVPQMGNTGQSNTITPTSWEEFNASITGGTSNATATNANTGGHDVRRALREAHGWSEQEYNEHNPAGGSTGGGSGGGSGGGFGKGKKKNKDKKNKGGAQQAGSKKYNAPCTFFQQGNCRHGDGCRFSHELNNFATGTNAGAHAQGQGAARRGRGGGGHVGRGVDNGAGPGAAGWPQPGEMEY